MNANMKTLRQRGAQLITKFSQTVKDEKKYSIQFEHNIVQILLAGFQEEILGQENMFA